MINEPMIKIVRKIIDLTNENKIQWKETWDRDYPWRIFTTVLEGKNLRLYFNEKIKLEVFNENVCIGFPDTDDLEVLYDIVKKIFFDVDGWLKTILEKY